MIQAKKERVNNWYTSFSVVFDSRNGLDAIAMGFPTWQAARDHIDRNSDCRKVSAYVMETKEYLRRIKDY